jgi:hypothetical protein
MKKNALIPCFGLLAAFALAFIFTACDTTGDGIPKLVEIRADTSAAKVSYVKDEDFSSDGIVITAVYDNGTTKTVPNGNVTFEYDFSSTGERVPVTVTYQGVKVTFYVSVTTSDVKDIEYISGGDFSGFYYFRGTGAAEVERRKNSFRAGDNGVVIKVNFTDDTDEQVTLTESGSFELNADGTVDIVYRQKRVKITDAGGAPRTVTWGAELRSLTVSSPSITCWYNDTFAALGAGLTVTANYETWTGSGWSKTTGAITYSADGTNGWSVTGWDTAPLSNNTTSSVTKEVIINYTDGSGPATSPIEVNVRPKPVSLIITWPLVTDYARGIGPVISGVYVAYAHSPDNAKKDITSTYTLSTGGVPYDKDIPGQYTVKAVYEESGITVESAATFTLYICNSVNFQINGSGAFPSLPPGTGNSRQLLVRAGESVLAALQRVTGDTGISNYTPVWAGTTFGGWGIGSGAGTAWNVSVTVTENLDLYAKWTRMITFNPNNNTSEAPVNVDVPVGSDAASYYLPGLDKFSFTVPAGMELAGWSPSAGGGTIYTVGASFTPVSNPTALHAVWAPPKITSIVVSPLTVNLWYNDTTYNSGKFTVTAYYSNDTSGTLSYDSTGTNGWYVSSGPDGGWDSTNGRVNAAPPDNTATGLITKTFTIQAGDETQTVTVTLYPKPVSLAATWPSVTTYQKDEFGSISPTGVTVTYEHGPMRALSPDEYTIVGRQSGGFGIWFPSTSVTTSAGTFWLAVRYWYYSPSYGGEEMLDTTGSPFVVTLTN